MNNQQIIGNSNRVLKAALVNHPQEIQSICTSRLIHTNKMLIKNGEVSVSGKLCVAITSSYDMQNCAAGPIIPIRRRRMHGRFMDGSWNYIFAEIIGIDGELKTRDSVFRKNQYSEFCFENFDITKDRLRIWDYSYTRNVSWTIDYIAYIIWVPERIFDYLIFSSVSLNYK